MHSDEVATPTFSLVYAGPSVSPVTGSTSYQWQGYRDGQPWHTFTSNKPDQARNIQTMAAVRISLDTQYEVNRWGHIVGPDGTDEYHAILDRQVPDATD